MKRYAVDAPTTLRVVELSLGVPPEIQLVGAASLRSDVMRLLFARSLSGRLTPRQAKDLLDRVAGVKLRLLGDRVSRSVAWDLAEELDWHDPTDAEVLAVARLQADSLVTGSARLVQAAGQLHQPIDVTSPDALLARLVPDP